MPDHFDFMFGPNVTIVPPMRALLAEQRNLRVKPDKTAHDIEFAKPVTIGDGAVIGNDSPFPRRGE